jgi:hypothetical protein
LFILSVLSSLACDNSHTQACYNVQFSSGVLIVFILPLPAIVGTILAIAIFKRR